MTDFRGPVPGFPSTRDRKLIFVRDQELVWSHLDQLNEVYRVGDVFQLLCRAFYYDARSYDRKAHTAVAKHPIDYARSPQATFWDSLFDALRRRPNLAVRLGEVRRPGHRSWILKEEPQQRLLSGDLAADDLSDDDFEAALRQKGVDMRIGLDIASITLKRQAGIIVLAAGDSDFVPAAKLARREGIQFILDPLWQQVPRDLFEYIDGLRSGFPRPRSP